MWIARYRIAGRDSAKVLGKAWTKRSRAPTGYLTREGAQDALRRFLAAEGARLVAENGMTFGQAADRYVASLEGRIRSGSFRASTLTTYRNIIEAELRPRWGERQVGTITHADIVSYRVELVGRGLAATTINQTRAIVRGIFAAADLAEEAAIAFERARTRRATSGAITFYRPEEIQQLAAHAADEQASALYLTAAFTGLRASELRALRWRSVDFADSLVHVERGFTDDGGEDLPKSYRVRSVPLMPKVAQVLAQLRNREFFTGDDDLVFAGNAGGVLDYDVMYRQYKAAQACGGVRRLRFHDLRHSFGTMAVRVFPIRWRSSGPLIRPSGTWTPLAAPEMAQLGRWSAKWRKGHRCHVCECLGREQDGRRAETPPKRPQTWLRRPIRRRFMCLCEQVQDW